MTSPPVREYRWLNIFGKNLECAGGIHEDLSTAKILSEHASATIKLTFEDDRLVSAEIVEI